MKKLLLLILPLALLTGCTPEASIDRRIAKHPDWFESLSRERQLLVRQGLIEEGMSKNAVYLAWGPAGSVRQGRSRGRETETWIYDTYEPHIHHGIGVGYGRGWGRYGYGYGFYEPYGFPYYHHDVHYTRRPVAKVEFQNDRVVEWEAARR